MQFLSTLDTQITSFIYYTIPHTAFFDIFFSFFSQRGLSIAIWIVLICFLNIFEEKKDRRFILYFLISFILAGVLSVVIFKNIFERPRPTFFMHDRKISNSCPTDYSFPSGHAAAAFAAATALAYFDKKRKYLYFVVAGLIGLSRIYLGCHYVGDVIAGALVGTGVTMGTIYTAQYANKSRKNRRDI